MGNICKTQNFGVILPPLSFFYNKFFLFVLWKYVRLFYEIMFYIKFYLFVLGKVLKTYLHIFLLLRFV